MMAWVSGVINRSIEAGSILQVSYSISAKTGRAPPVITAFAEATNVKLGKITSPVIPNPSTAR